MRLKFKGEDLGEFSGKPTIKECRRIKQELKMLPMQFQMALDGADPEAMCLLVAIMKKRKGEDIDWEEIDGEMDDFVVQYNAEEKQKMRDAGLNVPEDDSPEGKADGETASGTSDDRSSDSPTSTEPSAPTPPDSGTTTA